MAYLIENVLTILGAAQPFTRPGCKIILQIKRSAAAPDYSPSQFALNIIRDNKIKKASNKKATAQLALRVAFRLKPAALIEASVPPSIKITSPFVACARQIS